MWPLYPGEGDTDIIAHGADPEILEKGVGGDENTQVCRNKGGGEHAAEIRLCGRPTYNAVAEPEGGGVRGVKPPSEGVSSFFLACQYMKIPTDLDPNPPPFEEFWPRTPPPLKNS